MLPYAGAFSWCIGCRDGPVELGFLQSAAIPGPQEEGAESRVRSTVTATMGEPGTLAVEWRPFLWRMFQLGRENSGPRVRCRSGGVAFHLKGADGERQA
jgi:hypothetical protein